MLVSLKGYANCNFDYNKHMSLYFTISTSSWREKIIQVHQIKSSSRHFNGQQHDQEHVLAQSDLHCYKFCKAGMI